MLKVFAPEPAAVGPGAKLIHGTARATVDALTDRDDAYAVPMEAAHTYRLNLVARASCVRMAVYRPNTKLFDEADPLTGTSCGGYLTFTPGPDRSGVYGVRVTPSGGTQGPQHYALHVAPAGPDDVGPGLELRSGDTRPGGLAGAGVDVVDLYRFDVRRGSDVDLRLTGSRFGAVAVGVLSETGGRISSAHVPDRLRIRLQAGRYFVALRATDPRKARYTLRLLIREITTTAVAVDGVNAATIAAPRAVALTATVTPPSASGGLVRVQVDDLDPLQGWVFVKQFKTRVAGTQARISFQPAKIGRYRIHASFLGNNAASPNESGVATLVVGPPGG